MTRFKNLSSLLLHISTRLSTMNAYNIADPTVLDNADECLSHLNRVLWLAWLANEPKCNRCAKCTIFFSNRNTVHNCPYGKKNSSVLMHGHAIVGKWIRRLIIIQKPLKSWVLQLIAASFHLSQSMGLRCMSSNRVLFWTWNKRSNCNVVAFQIRITDQNSKKTFTHLMGPTNSRW